MEKNFWQIKIFLVVVGGAMLACQAVTGIPESPEADVPAVEPLAPSQPEKNTAPPPASSGQDEVCLDGESFHAQEGLCYRDDGSAEPLFLAMMAGAVLAGLRFFDPKDWKGFIARKVALFGRGKQKLLEAPDGNRFLADAHVSVEAAGYVDALAEALRTADHVLLRLAEPVLETTWTDDGRLMHFVQGLLEARAVDDGHFALKLVGSELESILNADGIEVIHYSRKTAKLFDILPALDLEDGNTKQAAPALIQGDKVLRRGTVWQA
ncbi:MAG: hypothetical protein L3J16_04270 [Anaerolineales bacterium]|nr:hypothetical protein [Anaerolineales bacterium]